jgi:hypothetical protein
MNLRKLRVHFDFFESKERRGTKRVPQNSSPTAESCPGEDEAESCVGKYNSHHGFLIW